jgi:hypothetical protein
LLRDQGISPETFASVLFLYSTPTWQSPMAQRLLDSLYRQETPYATSPKVESQTLRAVVAEARKFAVLPMFAGAIGSATDIATAHFVAALEMAAAGSGATLVLVAAASVADRLLTALATTADTLAAARSTSAVVNRLTTTSKTDDRDRLPSCVALIHILRKRLACGTSSSTPGCRWTTTCSSS